MKPNPFPIRPGLHLARIHNPNIFESPNVNNPRRPTELIKGLSMNFRLELLDECRNPTGLLVPAGVSLVSRHGRQAPIVRLADAAGCYIDPDNFEESAFEDAVLKVEIELHIKPHLGLIAVPVNYFKAR